MLTTRGRALLALGAGLLVGGRLLGLRELMMTGVALGIVITIGAVAVSMRRATVTVQRRVWPTRARAGQDVRVDLTVRAQGTLGNGPILLTDKLPEILGSAARLALEGGSGRAERTVTYTLGPRSRGRYPIGPLELAFTDPFGTVQRRREIQGTSTLIVYPAFEPVDTMPSGVQQLGIVRHSPRLGQGDEFYALRSYQDGDDLRKVHWPSSAKLGRMVLRQEELLGEPRLLLVLDTSAAKHRGQGPAASIEAAISACASVGTLALKRRMRLDVVTTDGPLLHLRRPREEDLLEHLAVLEPSSRPDLVGALSHLDPRRTSRAAVAVVISPELSREEIGLISRMSRATTGGAVVLVDAPSFDPDQPAARRPRRSTELLTGLGLPALELRAQDSFRHIWETGVRRVPVAR